MKTERIAIAADNHELNALLFDYLIIPLNEMTACFGYELAWLPDEVIHPLQRGHRANEFWNYHGPKSLAAIEGTFSMSEAIFENDCVQQYCCDNRWIIFKFKDYAEGGKTSIKKWGFSLLSLI